MEVQYGGRLMLRGAVDHGYVACKYSNRCSNSMWEARMPQLLISDRQRVPLIVAIRHMIGGGWCENAEIETTFDADIACR